MKTAAVALACFTTCVYSQVVQPPAEVFKRDAAAVTAAITSVGQQLSVLDQAVKNFSGDMAPLSQASDQVIASLQDSKNKLDSEPMTFAGAMTLAAPGKNIQTQSQALATDLKGRKADIAKAGGCDVAREKLGAINVNAQALMDTVVQKAPQGAATYGNSLTAELRGILDDMAKEFSPENCKNP